MVDADVHLGETDPADVVEAQWRRLCAAFESPDSVLLLHYWNHYALVYATREWREADSLVSRREVLTAKPAQRPCRWVSWEQLRSWLLQWQGYAVFQLRLLS